MQMLKAETSVLLQKSMLTGIRLLCLFSNLHQISFPSGFNLTEIDLKNMVLLSNLYIKKNCYVIEKENYSSTDNRTK